MIMDYQKDGTERLSRKTYLCEQDIEIYITTGLEERRVMDDLGA